MRYLQDKIVIVTGAGFSAPANLPIQDKILQEMTEPTEESIINSTLDTESITALIPYTVQMTEY